MGAIYLGIKTLERLCPFAYVEVMRVPESQKSSLDKPRRLLFKKGYHVMSSQADGSYILDIIPKPGYGRAEAINILKDELQTFDATSKTSE